MKKIILLFLISSIVIYGNESVFEKSFTYNGAMSLGMGNSRVANISGIESLEFNPAGLSSKNDLTIMNINFNLKSNLFKLNDDIIGVINQEGGTDISSLSLSNILFILESNNKGLLVEALLKQNSMPYENGRLPNDLGFSTTLSSGFVLSGFGLSLIVDVNSDVVGDKVYRSDFLTIVTTTLALGYAYSLPIGPLVIDFGFGLRPMYKIRSLSPLQTAIEYYIENKLVSQEYLETQTYNTGYGIGIDFGGKVSFKGLMVGISFSDFNDSNLY